MECHMMAKKKKKINISLPYDPAIPKEMKSTYGRVICIPKLTAAQYIILKHEISLHVCHMMIG